MSFLFPKSKEMFEACNKVIPGGVNSNIRFSIFGDHPLYFKEAKGSKVRDADGNEFIDCIVSFGAIILGHGDPDVTISVRRAIESGLTCGLESEIAFAVAEKIVQMIPGTSKVKFANSGTEAVLHALMIARGYTGKEKIVKAEGHYHGYYDYIYCSFRPPKEMWGMTPTPIPMTPGLTKDLFDKTYVIPWNDLPALERILARHGHEIGAVIMEPVNHNIGCALPEPGYLEGVRDLTMKHEVLLILDEIITGFRCSPGGAQSHFNVEPDLTTLGKAIANGYPMAAVCGKKEIMESVAPSPLGGTISYGGTFNGHVVCLAAALATLTKLATGEIQELFSRYTNQLEKGVLEISENTGIPGRLQGMGGQFQVYFLEEKVIDYRTAFPTNKDRYAKFQQTMLEGGILWSNSPYSHHGITAAHSNEDIQRILDVADQAFKKLS